MFKHKALALEGVGFGHQVLAILGTRWFDVEVIVTPPTVGGGGYVVGPDVYTVKFVVTLKSGKVITSEHKYTKLGLTTLEKVIATFKGGQRVIEYISIKASIINNWVQKIIVKVKK